MLVAPAVFHVNVAPSVSSDGAKTDARTGLLTTAPGRGYCPVKDMADSSKLETLSLNDLEFTLLVDSTSEILVVDDEDVMQMVFGNLFEEGKHHIDFASSGEQALDMLKEREYNLVVVDKNLPGMSGIELIPLAREIRPHAEFIIVTGYASYQSVVEALRLGAFDYLEKPFQYIDLVKQKVIQALDKQRLSHENILLAEQLREVHQELQKTVSELDQKKQPGAESKPGTQAPQSEKQLAELVRGEDVWGRPPLFVSEDLVWDHFVTGILSPGQPQAVGALPGQVPHHLAHRGFTQQAGGQRPFPG